MFCEKCGSLLVPEGRGFKCSKCGAKSKEKNLNLSEDSNVSVKEVSMVKHEVETLPKIKMNCRKCKNNEAYYYMMQTRAPDEAPTTFYTCTKCGHKWREG